MSFRKRTFQELVDNVLTDLTGGVVNEPIFFAAANTEARFPLANTPATRITAVTGTLDGAFHRFAETDYELTADRTSIQWVGETPDPDTSFAVDYYPKGATSPITDRNVGSVSRTLVEAISREMAVLYAQLDLVYKSGFLDLAEGKALEMLVTLLGLQRIKANREVGEVIFSRSTPAPGDITIPLGTEVVTPPLGADQRVFRFETTAVRTMRQGQTDVAVPIRFAPSPQQEEEFVTGEVPVNAITLLPKPIVGIERVTNPEATARGGEDESDAQLRQRAKKALADAGKSTADALRNAVLRFGPDVNVVVRDLPRGVPGEVELVISGANDVQQQADINRAVLASKAAGILVTTNLAIRVAVALRLRLEGKPDVLLSGDDARQIESDVAEAVARAINDLKAGEDISRNSLVAASLADDRIGNVVFESLTTQREGIPEEDSATRFRDAQGNPTSLETFVRVHIGQLETAEIATDDLTVTVVTTEERPAAGVRITVRLAAVPTPAGEGTDPAQIQPQLGSLVRGFVETPQPDNTILLSELIAFVEAGTGLFKIKPHPDSFLTGEHLGTGLIELEAESVTIGDDEQVQFDQFVFIVE